MLSFAGHVQPSGTESAFLCGNCSLITLFSIYSKLLGVRGEQAIQETSSISSVFKKGKETNILLWVYNVRHFTCSQSADSSSSFKI